MLRGLLVFGSVIVVLGASFYQLYLKEFLAVTVGVGRVIQTIDEFPYSCRRIENERLEACEDLWLDDEARVLYAACTGLRHRAGWNQAVDKLNVSARRPGGAELIALDIDSPSADGSFKMRGIKPVGYVGAAGDQSLDFVGFDAEAIGPSTLHFYMINQRPPVDAELNYIDPSKIGANSTIDIFEYEKGKSVMRHLRTVWSPAVYSPNRVAILGNGAFVLTNDHSAKVGLRKQFDPLLGGGNVAYCSPAGECHAATTINLKFPNGLTKGADSLIYVPSSIDGTVRIFEVRPDKMLKHLDTVQLQMPLDNLALDAKGDLYVPGFPDLLRLIKWGEDPAVNRSPVTVLRISTSNGEYKVTKVLEDGKSKIMTGVTTVRHDAKTGRLFMGAAYNNMVVCEPK